MGENIVFMVIVLLCGFVFIGIGITAFKMKGPIHFWGGSVVKSEDVADVKAYNKANGWMWLGYGSIYILTALVSLYKLTYGGIMLGVSLIPGLFILMSIYATIEKKYFIKKEEEGKNKKIAG